MENTAGKGETAGYSHFLAFTQCFKKSFFPQMNSNLEIQLSHSHTMTPFDAPRKQAV